MDVFWVVIGLFVLVCVLIALLLVRRDKPRRDKLAANRAWADKINQAKTDDAVLAIGDIRHSDKRAIDERVTAARSRYKKASETAESERNKQKRQKRAADEAARRQAATNRLDELRQREGTLTYEELEEFLDDPERYKWYLNEQDGAYLAELVSRLTKALADGLCKKARQGDTDSLAFLVELVFPDPDDRYDKTSPFQEQTGEAYTFPDDWNELIVRMIDNPSLDVFIGCERDPGPGAVRRRAAKALLPDLPWEERLVNAKIVLAYVDICDDDDQYVWRDEVGPILLAEVSKLEATIHRTQQLALAPLASTE